MDAVPMFGCLVPGRVPQFDAHQVSENQVVFSLHQCDQVKHVILFLTGSQPIPDGFVASLYLCWPNPNPVWYFLGFLSNDKPSVLFKMSKPKDGITHDMFTGWQPVVLGDAVAQIGIAVEPYTEATQKTAVVNSEVSNLPSFVEFTQKMLENVFNYCSSFGTTQAQMIPQPNETFIPLTALQKWYETFQRRMTLDPNFWKNL